MKLLEGIQKKSKFSKNARIFTGQKYSRTLDFHVSSFRKNLQKFHITYLSILRKIKKELGPYLISTSRSRYPENQRKSGVRLFKKYFRPLMDYFKFLF